VGLLREVAVEGAKTYFDTNTSNHYHFFCENSGELVDIETASIRIEGLPQAPEGMAIGRVDVLVRLVAAQALVRKPDPEEAAELAASTDCLFQHLAAIDAPQLVLLDEAGIVVDRQLAPFAVAGQHIAEHTRRKLGDRAARRSTFSR
jgi:hypothetical protein